jgi:hypothetical protein
VVFRNGKGRGAGIALLVVGFVAVLAILAWLNRPRDEPSKASVGDAVRSFREEGGAEGQGGKSGEPGLGVYRYGTRGSESVKGPSFGATHHYGGVSTVVVSAGRCSERERWQVLAGRWTETEACPEPHGKTLATVVEFHEFFGSPQRDSFRCRGPSGPSKPRPGTHYFSLCESKDSSISNRSRFVGTGEIAVGGKRYAAVHIESRSVLSGATVGTSRREEWRRRSDGLLLQRSGISDADTSEGGGSHYTERYAIRLLSTKPRR